MKTRSEVSTHVKVSWRGKKNCESPGSLYIDLRCFKSAQGLCRHRIPLSCLPFRSLVLKLDSWAARSGSFKTPHVQRSLISIKSDSRIGPSTGTVLILIVHSWEPVLAELLHNSGICKLTLCNVTWGVHLMAKVLKSVKAFPHLFYHETFTTGSFYTLATRAG